MTYVALARKYRPKRLTELVGQDHLVRILQAALQHHRVHHAYLFGGVRGVGKTTTARLLAQALNCAEQESAHPCGVCTPCQEIAAGRCHDVLEIDGASHTGVDHIRSLRETIAYLPSICRRKIYLIDEVHMLSQAAFNALLKTLEEPPAHVTFLFATTDVQKIPATILSRCQRMTLLPVSLEQLGRHFQHILALEGFSLPDVVIEGVAEAADGSVRDGLSLLEQAIHCSHGSQDGDVILRQLGLSAMLNAEHLWQALIRRDKAQVGQLLHTWQQGEPNPHVVLRQLMTICREVSWLQAGWSLPHATAVQGERRGQLSRLAPAQEIHRFFLLLQQIAQAMESSKAPLMVLEMGLLRWLSTTQQVQLDHLLGQLESWLGASEGQDPTLQGQVPPLAQGAKSAHLSSPPQEQHGPTPTTRTRSPSANSSAHLSANPAMPSVQGSISSQGDGATQRGQTKQRPSSKDHLAPAPMGVSEAKAPPLSPSTHPSVSAPGLGGQQLHKVQRTEESQAFHQAQAVAPNSSKSDPDPRSAHEQPKSQPAAKDKQDIQPRPKTHLQQDVPKTQLPRQPVIPSFPPSPPLLKQEERLEDRVEEGSIHAMPLEPTGAAGAKGNLTPVTAQEEQAPSLEPTQQHRLQVWQKIVAVVSQQRPSLGSVLEHGVLHQLGQECITLAFASGTFYWDALHEPAQRKLLYQAIEQVMGSQCKLTIVPLTCEHQNGNGLILAQQKAKSAQALHEQRRDQASQHQAVRMVESMFAAVVEEIRLLPEANDM